MKTGILTQASKAKEQNEIAEVKEQAKLDIMAWSANEIANGRKGALDDATVRTIIDGKEYVDTLAEDSFKTKYGHTIVYKDLYTTQTTPPVQEPVSREGLNVGDYINYEPDTVTTAYTKLGAEYTGYERTSQPASLTQDKLNWQILKKYEDGSMDVIGSPTSVAIYFKGARGYNNGVYVLNDICEELYSKKSEGITARSVNEEDFSNNMTDAGKAAKATYISDQVKSLTMGSNITNVDTENNTVTYINSISYYPILYKQEKLNRVGQSEKYYTESTLIKTDGKGSSYDQEAETLTVPYTYYNIATDTKNYGDAAKALSNSQSFWIASRYVFCYSDDADFGLRCASTSIGSNRLFSSSSTPYVDSNRVRPLVHLGAEVQIEACTGENKIGNEHTITQY